MNDDVAESFGCMTAEWITEQLDDFMYTFENDSDGEFVAKGSVISHHFPMLNIELIEMSANMSIERLLSLVDIITRLRVRIEFCDN